MNDWTKENIKALRESLGLTQTQFATLLGKSQGYVSRLEKGTRTVGIRTHNLLAEIQSEQTQKEAVT